jgi:hypothetical protein
MNRIEAGQTIAYLPSRAMGDRARDPMFPGAYQLIAPQTDQVG